MRVEVQSGGVGQPSSLPGRRRHLVNRGPAQRGQMSARPHPPTALLTCAAAAMTAAAGFDGSGTTAFFRVAAPLVAIAVLIPVSIALCLEALGRRAARALLLGPALLFVALGSAQLSDAGLWRTLAAYFAPAVLLLCGAAAADAQFSSRSGTRRS